MGKLRLDVDALEVQSFATGVEKEKKGTVRAHSDDTFNTAQYHCPEASYACTQTKYWDGCPSGGFDSECPNYLLPGQIPL